MVDLEKLRDLVEQVHSMDSLTERLTEDQLVEFFTAPESEETNNDRSVSVQDPMQYSYGL